VTLDGCNAGPFSSFMVISEPKAAKHVLRATDNPNNPIYDKGLVREVRFFQQGRENLSMPFQGRISTFLESLSCYLGCQYCFADIKFRSSCLRGPPLVGNS